jgi:hypothetical protein
VLLAGVVPWLIIIIITIKFSSANISCLGKWLCLMGNGLLEISWTQALVSFFQAIPSCPLKVMKMVHIDETQEAIARI